MGTIRSRVILVVERDGRRAVEASEALLSSGYWVVEARSVGMALRELEGGLSARAVVVSEPTLGAADPAARDRLAAAAHAKGAALLVLDRHDGVVARVACELRDEPVRPTG